MVKLKSRPSSITVGILVILTVILLGGIYSEKKDTKKSEENIVVHIEDYGITEEEYTMIAKENCNQVYMQFTTEQISDENFWENEINGMKPYKILEDIVLEKLKENYALKILAKDLGVEDYDTYEELVDSIEEQKQSDENYGLKSYEIESYYTYYYSNLETKIREKLIKDEVQITDEECLEYYKNNLDVYNSDISVDIIYAEIDLSEKDSWNTAYQVARVLETSENAEDIIEENFSQMKIDKLHLSSLETQEGISGTYRMRWELASQLQSGEVYGPYEDSNMYCVIKCIDKKKNEILDYSECKGIVGRQLQVQKADKIIEEKQERLAIIEEKEIIKNILKKIK